MNAKMEFLDHIKDRIVICAEINIGGDGYPKDECKTLLLKKGFSDADLEEFLSKLDFEYSDEMAWSSISLTGTIWYSDGTWSVRDAWNGKEWWSYMSTPEIPEFLK